MPLTFRRFSRKGYALFACMGREVRIGVLTVATLTSAAPCLFAQTAGNARADMPASGQDGDTLSLDEAVAVASRSPLAAGMAARQVMTLGREEIAAAGVTSVNDVLKLSAGVDVRQRGGFGIQSDISIDGGTFDQITLLVNGIPVNNPQTGHNAADFPVSLSDIERIEILEGAASRVHGSQAFGGAINIVTRRGQRPLDASVSGGSYGTVMGSARTAWQLPGGFSTSVSGSMQRSDGAVDNGEFRGGKVFWQGGYDGSDFRLEAQAGASLSDFGANTFYSGAYPNQWEATRRYLVSVRGETKGRVHLSPSVSWLRSVDHYQLIRDTPTGENFNRGDVFTAGLNAWTSWKLGRTAVGAEIREEQLYSTNLGRSLQEGQEVPVRGEDGIFYVKQDGRTNVSYFLEHNVLLQRWTISAGVLAERNPATGNKFRFYPGVDVSYRPGAGWRLYASFNRSMRLPTFTDLWYKSPTQEGNVGLRPEECSAFRIGADFRNSVVQLSAKAYYNRGTNLIDWVMRTPDDVYHAANFQLDNMGVGLTAAVDVRRWLGERQPFTRLTAAYAFIHQHRRDDAPYFKSNYAMEYLRHKFTATLSHRIVSLLSASWTLRVTDREGAYLAYEGGQSTGKLVPYGAHALLDCKVQWAAPRYRLFVDMQNLTSHRYYDLANVRQPGFLLMAGVGVTL